MTTDVRKADDPNGRCHPVTQRNTFYAPASACSEFSWEPRLIPTPPGTTTPFLSSRMPLALLPNPAQSRCSPLDLRQSPSGAARRSSDCWEGKRLSGRVWIARVLVLRCRSRGHRAPRRVCNRRLDHFPRFRCLCAPTRRWLPSASAVPPLHPRNGAAGGRGTPTFALLNR